MNRYKGRKNYLLLFLAAIGILFAFIAFKNPIHNFLNTVSGGLLFADEPSTELTSLYFKGYETSNFATMEPTFYDEDEQDYMFTSFKIFEDDTELEAIYTTKYSGATVSFSGDYPSTCVSKECDMVVTVTAPGVPQTTYTIYYQMDLKISDLEPFSTASISDNVVQEYVVPRTGTYRIEAWGAAGGEGCLLSGGTCSSTKYAGGYGAYTAGTITLQGGTKLYIYRGTKGTNGANDPARSYWSGGWNGGGNGVRSQGSYASGSGGGSTDVRLIKATGDPDDDTASLASRIMVAAGGGGGSFNEATANWSTHGGGLDVGGLTTKSTYCVANQSEGYAFGKAMDGTQTAIGIGGGGGGWYGGYQYVHSADANVGGPGCGGSSYISGHTGSIGVNSDGTKKASGTKSEDITDSYSNTGYVFTDTVMIDGYNRQWTTEPGSSSVLMPSSTIGTDGKTRAPDMPNGNTSHGAVIITQIAKYAKLDNKLTALNVSTGTLNKTFNSDTFDYILTLDTFTSTVDISGTIANPSTTTVSEAATYTLDVGATKIAYIFVTDKTSGAVNTYTVTIVRPELAADQHSTLIEKIDNPNNSTIYFDKDVTTYSLPIRYGKMSVNLTVHLYDSDATYVIDGADFLLTNTGIITITVTDPLATPNKTVYTLNYEREGETGSVDDEYIYYYTGAYQTFVAPISGDYFIELWGGQGGTMRSGWTGIGGKGGYTAGKLNLAKDDTLYVYVGGQGTGYASNVSAKPGGWNGGGNNYSGASGGGGATDIRLLAGTWNDAKSLNSRIMVAGGGGGSNDSQNGGFGGGLVAGTGTNGASSNGSGGSQIEGGKGNPNGSRGAGGGSLETNNNDGGSGGGGYFGGGKATGSAVAGGGGSSYISGYLGAIAVASEANSNFRKDSNEVECTAVSAASDVVCSYHYSGLIFEDPVMATGNEVQPTLNGKGYQTGNADAGYAKITPLSNKSENNYLENITFDYGTRDPVLFTPTVYDYTITTGIYTQFITLEGIPYDSKAVVEGDGKKLLEIGENKYTITVTAENGDIRTYNVTVIREGLKGAHSNMINNIFIKGVGFIYPVSGTYEYDFQLPYNKYGIEMDIKLYDEDAVYEVTGADLTVTNSGTVNIRVYHEDGSVPEVNYILNYTRQLPLYEVEGTYTYYCVKYQEEFVAPLDGEYYVETWGAAGGGATSDYYQPSHGGRGGYTRGTITLKQGESIEATVENGAYLGKKSHEMLHQIEQLDPELYECWNDLFLMINKMRIYPIQDVWEMIYQLRWLSEQEINEANRGKYTK